MPMPLTWVHAQAEQQRIRNQRAAQQQAQQQAAYAQALDDEAYLDEMDEQARYEAYIADINEHNAREAARANRLSGLQLAVQNRRNKEQQQRAETEAQRNERKMEETRKRMRDLWENLAGR